MKNDIINYAISRADINKSMLIELCDMMEDTTRERFVSALLGLVKPEDIIKDIPLFAYLYDHESEFKEYNYLTDQVYYAYHETKEYYFDTAERAKNYADTGNGSYLGKKDNQDGFTFAAIHTFTYQDSVPLSHWMDHAILK